MPKFNVTPASTIQLPFSQAIDWFTEKTTIPIDTIDRIIDEENQFAFYVTGLTKAEYLDTVKEELTKALTEGQTFKEFADSVSDISSIQGWSTYRQFIIWQTNVNQAYRQGRYEKLKSPSVWNQTVGLQWVHGNTRVPRPHHLALNGRIFPRDAVNFSGEAYPPCGFGCQCRVFPVFKGEADLATMEDITEDYYTDNAGVRYKWDNIADPGFKYIPNTGNRQSSLDAIRDRLPDELKSQVP
jgi:SPP1 gp7 family putative phage head morphogenesis protein